MGEMFDWKDIDEGDGLNVRINHKIHYRQRRTLAIIVAGAVGNSVFFGGHPISQTIPADIFSRPDEAWNLDMGNLQTRNDDEIAVKLARLLPGEGLDELIRGETTARRILKAKWFKVRRIEQALYRKQTIEGPEVKQLLLWRRRPWE